MPCSEKLKHAKPTPDRLNFVFQHRGMIEFIQTHYTIFFYGVIATLIGTGLFIWNTLQYRQPIRKRIKTAGLQILSLRRHWIPPSNQVIGDTNHKNKKDSPIRIRLVDIDTATKIRWYKASVKNQQTDQISEIWIKVDVPSLEKPRFSFYPPLT